MSDQQLKVPPPPPEIRRRITFYPVQLIGVSLLALIPILALLGVFGETFTDTSAGSSSFQLDVHYPERYRYKMLNSLVVTIHNTSSQPFDEVLVSFDSDYIDKFSTVVFTPSVEKITSEVHLIRLEDFEPGAVQIVNVELQGERYGLHSGFIRVEAENAEPAEVTVSTLIFP